MRVEAEKDGKHTKKSGSKHLDSERQDQDAQ